jgi:hypothetical protein
MFRQMESGTCAILTSACAGYVRREESELGRLPCYLNPITERLFSPNGLFQELSLYFGWSGISNSLKPSLSLAFAQVKSYSSSQNGATLIWNQSVAWNHSAEGSCFSISAANTSYFSNFVSLAPPFLTPSIRSCLRITFFIGYNFLPCHFN